MTEFMVAAGLVLLPVLPVTVGILVGCCLSDREETARRCRERIIEKATGRKEEEP